MTGEPVRRSPTFQDQTVDSVCSMHRQVRPSKLWHMPGIPSLFPVLNIAGCCAVPYLDNLSTYKWLASLWCTTQDALAMTGNAASATPDPAQRLTTAYKCHCCALTRHRPGMSQTGTPFGAPVASRRPPRACPQRPGPSPSAGTCLRTAASQQQL